MPQSLDLPSEGRLQIGTFALNVGTPVPNATIRISHEGEPDRVIEEMITDSSGQTPVLALPTPPVDFSLTPGSPMPYSEYTLNVTMEGFDPCIIHGVQILPDAVATQKVNLIPSPNLGRYQEPEEINIKPHTLYGEFPPKIPEDPIKPLPPSTGFVVLPDPVIPEFIVVHEGVPTDASAPNHWIPFADYIKNVASCEIYSTWPDESIRANVLAILSFTLNRVYTEWYRSQGFDFTITSSTAYDHAFTFGRNIYENISKVVDEIFTTFITKPNIRQPLLAQYCDGVTVSCPNWMTQWGSKDLGDQGYSAISILRNFYGQDVFLMQAERVSGVPVSFPGVVLQTGSTGPAVRTIQEQLNAISENYPAIQRVAVDGIYGESTRLAVETFQGIFNLPPTGNVDFSTWYRLSFIYVAVTQMAELV